MSFNWCFNDCVVKGWYWQYLNASPWKRLLGVLPQLLAQQSQALVMANSSGQAFLLDFVNYSSAVVQHNTMLKTQWEIRGNTCTSAWSNRCLDLCMYIGDHISQLVCTLLHFHGVQETVCAAPKAREQYLGCSTLICFRGPFIGNALGKYAVTGCDCVELPVSSSTRETLNYSVSRLARGTAGSIRVSSLADPCPVS